MIKADGGAPEKKKSQLVCFFVSEKSETPFGFSGFGQKIAAAVRQICKETKGKMGAISTVHTHQMAPAQRILVIGVGPREKIGHEQLRLASGKIAKKASELELKEYSIVLNGLPLDPIASASAVVEGASLALYSFDRYKKVKKPKPPFLSIIYSNPSKISGAISRAQKVSEGVNYTRSIANLPPNECNPARLAGFAKSISKRLKCTVISRQELKKRGFGGITAVGQGSKNEPKLIILEYNGKRGQRPTVLVGKAVTFDTGGISIKPAEKMDEMKFDKCGGCTVLGIMKAAAEQGLPVNLVGIVPSVENMPGGGSYRPGDILTMYGGKTAEILNTDAEGRLILFDSLTYGIKTYKPKEIIDFATLTGACIVALGTNVAGLVSNDKKLVQKIIESSERTGEQVWQLPIDEDYMEMVKSDYAEIKNVGPGRVAGTITAAAFLANAIDDTPWAHFDIAGTAWIQTGSKEKSYNPKGATGFGVRLILDYLARST